MKYDRTEPCKSCPYRRSAPRKLWAPIEFKNLLAQEADPHNGAIFNCHEGRRLPIRHHDQRPCVGWLIHQKKNGTPSIMLRLLLIQKKDAAELYEKLNTKLPDLFRTLAAMCRANGVDPKRSYPKAPCR